MTETSTIAALATAPAPAGIAVIRVSGPKTRTALKALFRSKQAPTDHPRKVIFGELVDFRTSKTLDKAVAFYMPNPNSYTGEDVAEFQIHGNLLMAQKILRSLFAFGISPAEAGEFTKRAFLNGKIDLVQAEAVHDLINATNERALKIAGEHIKGRLSSAVDKIGEPLRNILAELEAAIDFPEEDLEPQTYQKIDEALSAAQDHISQLLATYSYGAVVKDGFRVLLCGPPNAGKSSLMNVLLERERAIVTEVSGTTRDLIEEETIISGYPYIFCDSAGIKETDDSVERIGVELAREKISWADLVLLVVDATDTDMLWEGVLEDIRQRANRIWLVINKIDLNADVIGKVVGDPNCCSQNFYISVLKKEGLSSLSQALVEEVANSLSESSDTNNIVTNERHRAKLGRASESLGRARFSTLEKHPLEIICAEINLALSAIDEIIGKTYTEDILGRIFSKFCIGK